MTSGRKPVPTALKILRGNPGKRPLEKIPEQDPISQIPEMLQLEDNLIAREEWDRLFPQLEKLGLLKDTDRTAFLSYCLSFQLWTIAHADIARKGITTPTERGIGVNPSFRVATEALNSMKAFMLEFGLTPASRTKVKYPEPKTDADPMENFLNGKKQQK